jgi:hypothetical protein
MKGLFFIGALKDGRGKLNLIFYIERQINQAPIQARNIHMNPPHSYAS